MNPQSSLSQITSQVLYPLVQAAETKDAKIVKVSYYYFSYFCCHYSNITTITSLTVTVITTIIIIVHCMCVWQCAIAVRPVEYTKISLYIQQHVNLCCVCFTDLISF